MTVLCLGFYFGGITTAHMLIKASPLSKFVVNFFIQVYNINLNVSLSRKVSKQLGLPTGLYFYLVLGQRKALCLLLRKWFSGS